MLSRARQAVAGRIKRISGVGDGNRTHVRSLGSVSADSRIARAMATWELLLPHSILWCQFEWQFKAKGAWLGIPINSQLIERAPLGISWQFLAGWLEGLKGRCSTTELRP